MYNRQIAIFAAALAAIHPFLIYYSTTVFCEATFLTLILTAIYLAMRSMDNPRPLTILTSGVFYGLAYLVRPEALAYMVVATCFLVLQVAFQGRRHRFAFLGRLLLVLGFLLPAAPYITWLSVHAGQFLVEGKSIFNLPTERRIQQGLPEYEAASDFDPDLTTRGTWLKSSSEAIKEYDRQYRVGFSEFTKQFLKKTIKMANDAKNRLGSSSALGSPVLIAFAVLGLFSRPWNAHLAIIQLHIGIILALALSILFFTSSIQDRFYIIFVPFLLIWTAFGILVFSRWAQRSAAVWGFERNYRANMIIKLSQVVAVLALILPPAAIAAARLKARHRSERQFKATLIDFARSYPAPMRVASTSTPAAFEAHADFVWLPYTDGVTARRYLSKKAATHVILWQNSPYTHETPYTQKWIDEGVPDARRAVDVSSSVPGGPRLIIRMSSIIKIAKYIQVSCSRTLAALLGSYPNRCKAKITQFLRA